MDRSCSDLQLFDDFFEEEEKFSWLPFKNKVADDTLHFQSSTNFPVKLLCLDLALLFISYFAFILQTADFFFQQKCQMKAGH